MITPVILCNEHGLDLWPSERSSFSKRFVAVRQGHSLFQNILRCLSGADFHDALVIAQEADRTLVNDQIHSIDLPGAQAIFLSGLTGPVAGVLSAALKCSDPDQVLLVISANCWIGSPEGFTVLVRQAGEKAVQGTCVMLTRPDQTERSAPEALAYLCRVSDVLVRGKAHAPHLLDYCKAAQAQGGGAEDVSLPADQRLEDINELSLETLFSETEIKLVTVELGSDCAPIGGWDSLHDALDKSAQEVSISGPATAVDCADTLLRCEVEDAHLVGIGLKNIAAVATKDAFLVVDLDHAPDMGQTLSQLETLKPSLRDEHPRHHRPWGWYETLCLGDRFQVKRIMVKPGGVLSLQSHVHRSEHWVIVAGSAQVTLGDEIKLLSENDSIYIPVGAVHRVANPGKLPMYLIEVQTGAYLGEDDIERYEDIYNRC